MQAYGALFARIYNERWAGFAQALAPRILELYAATEHGRSRQPILDLCCGTGQLAAHFLKQGYRVIGLDLSDPMLIYARRNTAEYVATGQAQFIQGDAADFTLNEQFGLVTSTFDALNHLSDLDTLGRCFHCVADVLLDGGLFLFDLNTRLGLSRWNGIQVTDEEELMLVNRGIYDAESGRAYTRISGFVRMENDHYHRFEETVYNVAFDLTEVRDALQAAGFQKVYCATGQDLHTPLDNPESVGRAFFVATK